MLLAQMIVDTTNAAAATIQAASSGGGMSPLNLTVLFSVITISLAAMGTLINIFGRKRSEKKENIPSENNPFCQQHKKELEDLLGKTKDNSQKSESIKEVANKLEIEVAKLVKDNENINKGMAELKNDNKELAQRLDSLLKQLLQWMNDS